MRWGGCCVWDSATSEATRLTLGVPPNAVAFRGMVRACVQAARPAGLGSRGCVRSRCECGAHRSKTRAAAKKMFVIVGNLTRMIYENVFSVVVNVVGLQLVFDVGQ